MSKITIVYNVLVMERQELLGYITNIVRLIDEYCSNGRMPRIEKKWVQEENLLRSSFILRYYVTSIKLRFDFHIHCDYLAPVISVKGSDRRSFESWTEFS